MMPSTPTHTPVTLDHLQQMKVIARLKGGKAALAWAERHNLGSPQVILRQILEQQLPHKLGLELRDGAIWCVLKDSTAHPEHPATDKSVNFPWLLKLYLLGRDRSDSKVRFSPTY